MHARHTEQRTNQNRSDIALTTNNFIQHNRQNSHNHHDERKKQHSVVWRRSIIMHRCIRFALVKFFGNFHFGAFRVQQSVAHFSPSKTNTVQTGGSLWIWNMNLNLILWVEGNCYASTRLITRCHNYKRPTNHTERNKNNMAKYLLMLCVYLLAFGSQATEQ